MIGAEQRGSGGKGREVRTRHPVALCSVVRIMHSVGTLHRPRRLPSEKMVRNFDVRGRGGDGIERLRKGEEDAAPIARMAPITNPIPT